MNDIKGATYIRNCRSWASSTWMLSIAHPRRNQNEQEKLTHSIHSSKTFLHTHTHTRARAHSLSLSLSLSHTHTHTHHTQRGTGFCCYHSPCNARHSHQASASSNFTCTECSCYLTLSVPPSAAGNLSKRLKTKNKKEVYCSKSIFPSSSKLDFFFFFTNFMYTTQRWKRQRTQQDVS